MAERPTQVAECPKCGTKEETTNYVLFQCRFAILVWVVSPLAFMFSLVPSYSIYKNMAGCLI